MAPKNMIYGVLLGAIVVLLLNLNGDTSQPNQQSLASSRVIATATSTRNVPTVLTDDVALLKTKHHNSELKSGDLRELLRQSTQTATYRPATPAGLRQFESLMVRTLQTSVMDSDLVCDWFNAGWQVHNTSDQTLVISELPDQRSGRGIYAIRATAELNLVLQAPHRFYDEGSGLIVRKLFHEHSVRAAAWNSVHRRQVDLAHCDDHYLNAFTRAVVTVERETKILQVHGFSPDKYAWTANSSAATAQVILSNGTKFPSRQVVSAAANLKSALDPKSVLLFPDEIDVLGGTTNRQGQQIRDLGSHGFVHVELAKDFRDRIIRDASVRESFLRSFTKR
ncbi:MAG: hypothetical protein WBD20_22150 [Pirellulaceae bacterium]